MPGRQKCASASNPIRLDYTGELRVSLNDSVITVPMAQEIESNGRVRIPWFLLFQLPPCFRQLAVAARDLRAL